jgi:hypothetical protein
VIDGASDEGNPEIKKIVGHTLDMSASSLFSLLPLPPLFRFRAGIAVRRRCCRVDL